MSDRIDEHGQPIYDYPEKVNSPHYNKYLSHMRFLVQRQYFEGTPISRDDHKELVDILALQKSEA